MILEVYSMKGIFEEYGVSIVYMIFATGLLSALSDILGMVLSH